MVHGLVLPKNYFAAIIKNSNAATNFIVNIQDYVKIIIVVILKYKT